MSGMFILETYLSRPPRKESAAVNFICLACIFLVSFVYWGNSFGLRNHLVATHQDVFAGHQYWKLFTSILVHADLNHFLSNAFGLFIFGYLLYGYFGGIVYPFMSFALGTLVQLCSLSTYPPEYSIVGASGVVYLMAAFWLTMFVLVERRFGFFKRLLRTIGFAIVMLLSSTFDPAISYRTHAIGFAAGVVFGLIYFFMNKEQIRAAETFEAEDDGGLDVEQIN
jgi:rhomboid protease GluP